ncbi:uncharacterized protein [Mytilus edulis]|uniref:uncharacterized protein n=1 Tax=Mytilus edulis TaxID=6550 RepID=UPI0039EF12D1
MDNITFSVFWQLGQEVIELGKPLILQCSIVGMDHIPADKSRQWTGEINNRLFTFNGVSTCPSNYTEILEPPNSFKIYFNYTSMINLNSPYTCRVGTMFDEKILKVNESNFVYMPTRRTTKFLESTNGSYRMHFNIERVYPKPTCRITTGKIWFNFSVITEQKLGFLYNVTFYYESSKEVKYCGDNLSVDCIVSSKHNRSFNYPVRKLKPCQSENGSQVSDMGFVAISAFLFVLVLLVCTIYVICKRKKLYDYRTVSLDTETNDVAFHIHSSLT